MTGDQATRFITRGRTADPVRDSGARAFPMPFQSKSAALVGFALGLAAATPALTFRLGPLKISDAIIVLTFIVVVATRNPQDIRGYRPCLAEGALALFVFAKLALELFNSTSVPHPVRGDTTIQFAIYGLAFIAARLGSRGSLVSFLRGFVIPGVASAVFAIAQVMGSPLATNLVAEWTSSTSAQTRITEGTYARATAFVGHWTGYGVYLLVITLALLFLFALGASSLWSYISLVLIGMGAFSTLTFSIALGFTLITCAYFIVRRSALLMALFTIGMAGALAGPLSDLINRRISEQFSASSGSFARPVGLIPETLVYRWQIWSKETIPAISERPLSGWGEGFYTEFGNWPRFPEYAYWPSAESQWLFVLVTSGLVGFLTFLILIIACAKILLSKAPTRTLVTGSFIVVIAAAAFTAPVITNAGLPAAAFALLGALVASSDSVSLSPARNAPDRPAK